MKIYLYPNLDKTHCFEYTTATYERLRKNGAKLFMDRCYKHVFGKLDITFCSEDECVKQCDMIIAIGGDGTILKCSLKGCEFEKPILGINCGRLGFMASLEHSQLELLDKLFSGEYTLSRRMMLNVNVECGSENKSYTALNDVAVTKADDCKIADFEVSKNGRLISSLRADGVILSTATGSTAYSMSAGGPIIEPEMKCIEFTQICAHSLFARSMILSEDSVMKVKCHTNSGSHAIVSVDGNNVFRLSAEDTVIVSKSKYFVEKDSNAFEESLESVSGIKHIIKIMTYSIMLGGMIVLSLILVLWLRERIYEIGIFLSIGTSKMQIIMQFIFELIFISMPSIISSLLLGNVLLKVIVDGFINSEDSIISGGSLINNSGFMLNIVALGQSYLILISIIVLSVVFASSLILIKKPKEILSKIS